MPGGPRATGWFGNGWTAAAPVPPDFISEALGLPPHVPTYLTQPTASTTSRTASAFRPRARA